MFDEEDAMNAWAKHEKNSRAVKEEQGASRVIGDDWGSSRIRVDAEHLQVDTGPRGGLLKIFFYTVRFLAFSTALMIGIGEFFTFKILHASGTNVSMWIRYMTLFYLVFQAFVIALNELGVLRFLSDSTILRVWITRGLLYAYVGVLCLQQTQIIFTGSAANDKVHGASLRKYLQAISYMMISWGLLYVLMWMLCLQRCEASLRQEAKESAEQERNEEKERRKERREKGNKKEENNSVAYSGEAWAA